MVSIFPCTKSEIKDKSFICIHTKHEAAEALRVINEDYQDWGAEMAYSNKIRQGTESAQKAMRKDHQKNKTGESTRLEIYYRSKE